MIHLGDITAISGYTVPPVDAVIGGSPCQDLSVAGKRAGLAGERSSLFMEQIRIIKEMREADVRRGHTGKFIRPRFMVWENVPGAFSSNKGEDFRAVLEETIRVAEPDAPDVPLPPKGKWPLADCWFGDGWSVAYRVLDAQFWGVPQRRRRIALVADFGGHAAPEILFVRQGVCGDTAESGAAGEETAAEAGGGADCARRSGTDYLTGWDNQEKRVFSTRGVTPTLAGGDGGGGRTVCGYISDGRPPEEQTAAVYVHQNQLGEVRVGPVAGTLNTNSNASGRNAPLVFDARGNGDGKTACTLTGDHQSRVTDYTAIVMRQHNFGEYREGVGTLTAHNGTRHASETLVVGGQVRRLTPLECERLQGYPDGWTDIGPWEKIDKKGKIRTVPCADSLRYKALGNSIALPPWAWLLKRLCGCYERTATMASLFDGIGGFPLIWERLNGPGSCLWASEIEEFPIAVTKAHFDGKSRW